MTAWTKDRIEHLKRRWPLGESAETLAQALGGGLTRNAVLSKARRLGLAERRPSAAVKAASLPPVPGEGRTSILEVRRCDCRWPYGEPDGPGFRLCGRPVARAAYCAAHAALAYRSRPCDAEALMRLSVLT